MKADIKDQWLAALRSGEYAQGMHRLTYVPDGGRPTYCCLGVLCDLAIKAGLDIEVATERFGDDTDHLTYDGDEGVLPRSVQEWAGLDESNPLVKGELDGDWGPITIAELNDGGKTFAQIADIIEEEL